MLPATVRRLSKLSEVFADDSPRVFILAPSEDRPIPAGDTRRGTAYLFREQTAATEFAAWLLGRHRIHCVPVRVELRQLMTALAAKDLIYLLDPLPKFAYGNPLTFRAPHTL